MLMAQTFQEECQSSLKICLGKSSFTHQSQLYNLGEPVQAGNTDVYSLVQETPIEAQKPKAFPFLLALSGLVVLLFPGTK